MYVNINHCVSPIHNFLFEFFSVFFCCCVLDTRFVLSLPHTGCRSKHSGVLLVTGLAST